MSDECDLDELTAFLEASDEELEQSDVVNAAATQPQHDLASQDEVSEDLNEAEIAAFLEASSEEDEEEECLNNDPTPTNDTITATSETNAALGEQSPGAVIDNEVVGDIENKDTDNELNGDIIENETGDVVKEDEFSGETKDNQASDNEIDDQTGVTNVDEQSELVTNGNQNEFSGVTREDQPSDNEIDDKTDVINYEQSELVTECNQNDVPTNDSQCSDVEKHKQADVVHDNRNYSDDEEKDNQAGVAANDSQSDVINDQTNDVKTDDKSSDVNMAVTDDEFDDMEDGDLEEIDMLMSQAENTSMHSSQCETEQQSNDPNLDENCDGSQSEEDEDNQSIEVAMETSDGESDGGSNAEAADNAGVEDAHSAIKAEMAAMAERMKQLQDMLAKTSPKPSNTSEKKHKYKSHTSRADKSPASTKSSSTEKHRQNSDRKPSSTNATKEKIDKSNSRHSSSSLKTSSDRHKHGTSSSVAKTPSEKHRDRQAHSVTTTGSNKHEHGQSHSYSSKHDKRHRHESDDKRRSKKSSKDCDSRDSKTGSKALSNTAIDKHSSSQGRSGSSASKDHHSRESKSRSREVNSASGSSSKDHHGKESKSHSSDRNSSSRKHSGESNSRDHHHHESKDRTKSRSHSSDKNMLSPSGMEKKMPSNNISQSPSQTKETPKNISGLSNNTPRSSKPTSQTSHTLNHIEKKISSNHISQSPSQTKKTSKNISGLSNNTPRSSKPTSQSSHTLNPVGKSSILTGSSKSLTLAGKSKSSTLTGKSNSSILTGNSNSLTLTGSSKSSILAGNSKSSTLTGSSNSSTLAGSDSLYAAMSECYTKPETAETTKPQVADTDTAALFGESDDSDWDDLAGEEKGQLSEQGKDFKRLLVSGQKSRQAHTASYDTSQIKKPILSRWTDTNSIPKKSSAVHKVKQEKVALNPETGTVSGKYKVRDEYLQKATSLRQEVEKESVTDPFCGIRIINPRISMEEFRRKMEGRNMMKISRLLAKGGVPDLQKDNWVTMGVVVHKTEPRQSAAGKAYCIWKLSGLQNCDKTVTFFLFGNVYKEHWKNNIGVVIGLLNPSIMDKAEKNQSDVAITINHPQQLLMIGISKDLDRCRATTKAGAPCSSFTNKTQGDFCTYHVQAAYRKSSSKRTELQATTGVTPKAFQPKKRGSQDSCFFYAGTTFSLNQGSGQGKSGKKMTLKKLQTFEAKKAPGKITTMSLHELEPEDELRLQKLKEKDQNLLSLLSVPTAGSMNFVKHLVKKDVTSTPLSQEGEEVIQTPAPSAKDLLKQHDVTLKEKRLQQKQQAQILAAVPTIGKGLSFGDSISLDAPLKKKKLNASAEFTKQMAIAKIKAKGGISKEDPNAVKKKITSPESREKIKKRVADDMEPATDSDAVTAGSPTASTSTRAAAEHREPPKKKSKLLGDLDLNSPEVQALLKKKSKHTGALEEAEAEHTERYFNVLEKKEAMEDKMDSIMEQECIVFYCAQCKYRSQGVSDRCKKENHTIKRKKGMKRFFKCKQCKKRSVCLDRFPVQPCDCGNAAFERVSMLKERKGPTLESEELCLRGNEQKFIGSLQGKAFLNG